MFTIKFIGRDDNCMTTDCYESATYKATENEDTGEVSISFILNDLLKEVTLDGLLYRECFVENSKGKTIARYSWDNDFKHLYENPDKYPRKELV